MLLHTSSSRLEHGVAESRDSVRYGRYLAYRAREASALLGVIPKEGIRPLYRAARDWAVATGVHEPKDPMATLLAYCERLLPLPPLDEWLVDYDCHRLAYMQALAGPPLAPVEAESVVVAVRGMRQAGEPTWYATLLVSHDGVDWRGHLRFHSDASDGQHRTAEIFIEDELEAIKDRFETFSEATLVAFMKSTLP